MFLLIYKGISMLKLKTIKTFLTKKYLIFIINKLKNIRQNVYFKNSTTKYSMNSSCTMELSSKTKQKQEEINTEVKTIVKKYFNTPEKLIQYIKAQGAIVYKINNAEKILNKFGEEEGFITPLKGIKAFLINLIIGFSLQQGINIKFKTNEIFIFNTNNTEIYTVARALYKYYGYKNQLPGYDYKSQETFKKLYNQKRHHSSPFENCSIEEMYSCKEAIARDMESINFTIELSKEYEQTKKAAKKLITESSINI